MSTKEELRDVIHSSIKAGSAVFGFNKSMDLIKKGQLHMVVVANNAPEDKLKELKDTVAAASARMETFEGDSKELGVICGKPFPILVLVIKHK